jgi:alcohol dehydrogenase class IV
MDIAKACAGLFDAPLPPACYHRGEPVPPARVAFVAAPTVAGTGSEATIVSVLTDQDRGIKKSIRHPSYMARLVILDADLPQSCPAETVASSGMDAFTQAVESFVSIRATWFSEVLSLKATGLVFANLESVFHGEHGERAAHLLEGSYLAGLALGNARLGLVHGLAHPLGHRYDVPHGLVCGVCLPAVIRFNREAVARKYARLDEALGADVLSATERLLESLELESPFKGKPVTDRDGIIAETLASGSTDANPRPVTESDVARILDEIF